MKTQYIVKRLFSGMLLIVGGCASNPDLAGDPPPPKPVSDRPVVRTYDYTHTVAPRADRGAKGRWTVAIIRFGDTRQPEDVPFGTETQPADQAQADVNVSVRIVQQEKDPKPLETPPQVNKRARELLKHALVECNAFTVVERERVLDILREIQFGKTRYVDPETAPEEGGLLGVRYLIEGSLGCNEDRTLKDQIYGEKTYKDINEYQPGFLENLLAHNQVNQKQQMIRLRRMYERRLRDRVREEFDTACYLSAYDVYTGQVVVSVMGLGANGLEAIDDAVEELTGAFADLRTDVRVAALSGDRVYLDAGEGDQINIGDRFQIIHVNKPIRDRDGMVIGYEETEVGEVEVQEVRPMLAVATAVGEVGEISRGDIARPAHH